MSENILQKWVSWTSYSAIKPLDKPKLPTYMRYFLLFSRILSILLKFTGVSLQKIQRYSSVDYCINRWLWLFTIAWGCLCWIIFTRDQNIKYVTVFTQKISVLNIRQQPHKGGLNTELQVQMKRSNIENLNYFYQI